MEGKEFALVFERNEDDYFLLNSFLERQGFRVERIKDYRELVTRALILQPAVIFYSWQPDDPYGCQLLKSTPETREIPLLLIVPDLGNKAWQKNGVYADEFISKPLNLTDLEGRIYRFAWLAEKKGQREFAVPPKTELAEPPIRKQQSRNQEARKEEIKSEEDKDKHEGRGEFTTAQSGPARAARAPATPRRVQTPPPASQARPRAPVLEVEEPVAESPPEPTAAPDPATGLYEAACSYMLNSLKAAAEGKQIVFEEGQDIVGRIQDSLLRDKSLLSRALDQRAPYFLSAHSTNVCILAGAVGMALAEPVQNRGMLGLAALFHDLGSVRLPPGFLFKVGKFTEDELRQLHSRPEYGRDLVLAQQPAFRHLAQIIYQVHEREDGSGYPLGLRGTEIEREAQIIGLADYYEAHTHPRPHRDAFPGFAVLNQLAARQPSLFATNLIITFIRSISLYSVNENVLLGSGEIARVVELTDNPIRPIVEVSLDSQGQRLSRRKLVNLQDEGTPPIDRSLSARDVLERFST